MTNKELELAIKLAGVAQTLADIILEQEKDK